jgi:hypothetical protein
MLASATDVTLIDLLLGCIRCGLVLWVACGHAFLLSALQSGASCVIGHRMQYWLHRVDHEHSIKECSEFVLDVDWALMVQCWLTG